MIAGFLAWLASFSAGAIVKVLGKLGMTFLQPLLDYYQSADLQETARHGIWTKAIVGALNAEVAYAKVKSEERIALWNDPVYKWLTVFLVAPSGLYLNSVLFVSIFHNLGWEIKAAPELFITTAMSIVMTFLGVLGGTAAVVGGVRALKRK
jgi:hypothetical protein